MFLPDLRRTIVCPLPVTISANPITIQNIAQRFVGHISGLNPNHFSAAANAEKTKIQKAMMPTPIRIGHESRKRCIENLDQFGARWVLVMRSCQESWSSSRKVQA